MVSGPTFSHVGDQLAERGFDMTRASANQHGVLVVPHRDGRRQAARLFKVLEAVAEEPKAEDAPLSIEVANAMLAGESVAAGVHDGPPLQCRGCGHVHPEGAVCLIPILFEMRCCYERTYPHDGPHEATDPEGVVTHRWVEELVITDLAFNAYGGNDGYEMEDND
jgi:hypothetical protein